MKHLLLCLLFVASCNAVSLEEKVGSLLMVHFHGQEANSESKRLIQELHVGGFIYYSWSNGLDTPEQVALLSKSLQAQRIRDYPLLIAVDQEGGRVSRLKFMHIPSQEEIGASGKPFLAKEVALSMGKELKSYGINLNLAPVVDVNSNPHNPIIGSRSFGKRPQIVADFGLQALEGYKEAKILSCLKHFPGHGDTAVDSHVDLPLVNRTLQDLENQELYPFRELSPFADCIMTAHIIMPALDPDYPATLSKKILTLLRDEFHFQGAILSDSLMMQGVIKASKRIEEAAIMALLAGCDMLILGGRALIGQEENELQFEDIKRIHQALLDAIKSGRLPQERIDEAYSRILHLITSRLVVADAEFPGLE